MAEAAAQAVPRPLVHPSIWDVWPWRTPCGSSACAPPRIRLNVGRLAPPRMERGQARDPQDGHAAMETAKGSSQTLAVRWGDELLAPDRANMARLEGTMQGLGPRDSAKLVVDKDEDLRVMLMPRTLDSAAKGAAAAYGVDDPRRPAAIVAAQARLVLSAGPAVIAAARSLAEHTGALNGAMPGWAAGAGVYGRDGAAEEAADAVERGMFVRRPIDDSKFTAMSVDLDLGQHADNQVKMYISQKYILSPVLVVEYHPFRARLPGDHEEIDSPKAAANAYECEVRIPDGARVVRKGVRVMARRRHLDLKAHSQLERLKRLEVEVLYE